MTDSMGWKGEFHVYVNGKYDCTLKNRITDRALNEIMKVLQGENTDMELKYLALGTSNAPIQDTDIQLGNEIFRTQFQSKELTGIGVLESVAIVLPAEAVGTIEEIGIFGGSTATEEPNTGIMISRILWHREKTSLEELQFTRIDSISRG